MPEILKVSADNSEESVLESAAAIVARGGVIAYPTETFYGLGADATNEQAVKRIYEIKGRNFINPISIIIGRPENLYPLVHRVSSAAQKLIQAFWPGALTIIFKASDGVLPVLTAGTGKIGVRVSASNVAQLIAQKLGQPLTKLPNRSETRLMLLSILVPQLAIKFPPLSMLPVIPRLSCAREQ